MRGSEFVGFLCAINGATSERELGRIEARLAAAESDSRRLRVLDRLAARLRELAGAAPESVRV